MDSHTKWGLRSESLNYCGFAYPAEAEAMLAVVVIDDDDKWMNVSHVVSTDFF